jgi:hypothetical protein
MDYSLSPAGRTEPRYLRHAIPNPRGHFPLPLGEGGVRGRWGRGSAYGADVARYWARHWGERWPNLNAASKCPSQSCPWRLEAAAVGLIWGFLLVNDVLRCIGEYAGRTFRHAGTVGTALLDNGGTALHEMDKNLLDGCDGPSDGGNFRATGRR